MRFRTRTAEVVIDLDGCVAPDCGFACVKACRLYGRSVLKIENGKPALAVSPQEAVRIDNECLACEIHCQWYGSGVIEVRVPVEVV